MAAPRKQKITQVPNLYASIDPVDKKYRFRYRNVITKKMSRLKTRNLEEAELKAQQLNAIIAQRIIDEESKKILTGDNSHGISIGKMLDLYLESLAKRVAAKEIKLSTLKDREWKTAFLRKNYSKHRLSALTTLEINKILKHFTTRGKHRMAQSVRSILIDFFNEAIAAGYFPADKPNPAQVTRSPRVKVKRARMTLEVFLKALEWAKANLPPRAHLSMQLALVTAQRREDIVNLKLSRIESLEELDPDNSKKNQKKKDPPHSGIVTIENVEYLAIRQNKTGNKLLIPLDLKMESINLSVRDVISQCRDNIVSEYAIHHNLSTGKIRKGQKISPLTASRGVSTSIAALNMDWGNSEPPTFHEIRSLSEREYSKQGVNTQYLLGHKHKRMTEVYHDARGHDWVKVPLSEGAR